MELQEVLLKRRSVRKFTEDLVSDEDINKLMHAAMSGPSACNKKPWEFYVISNKEILHSLRRASPYTRMDAPLAIVVVGNLDRSLPRELAPYWVQDCSAATENILLCAVDLGLGAVWCGIHPQERAERNVANLLGLSSNQIPLNVIYLGHPAEQPSERDQYDEANIHYVK